MRLVAAVALLIPLAGCARGPVTVHGKPVHHWVEALHDKNPLARQRAVQALGNVGAADPEAVPGLVQAVKDRDARVRRAAVLALLRIGPEAGDAVPALAEAQKDADPKVRSYAAKALARIQAGG